MAQQKGLAFDVRHLIGIFWHLISVSTLPQFDQDASVRIQLIFFFFFFFFFNQLFSEPLLLQKVSPGYIHTNMGLNWGSTGYK